MSEKRVSWEELTDEQRFKIEGELLKESWVHSRKNKRDKFSLQIRDEIKIDVVMTQIPK